MSKKNNRLRVGRGIRNIIQSELGTNNSKIILIGILIIDQDSKTTLNIRLLLAPLGFRIDNVTNSKDAIKHIKNNNYNLILLDCQLHGAINLVKEINKNKIPFIILARRANIKSAFEMMKFRPVGYAIAEEPYIHLIPHIVKDVIGFEGSEKKYFALMQNLPVGIYRATAKGNGKFEMANPAMAEMFGCNSVEEFKNIPVSHVYAEPSGRKTFINEIKKKKQFKRKETYLKRKDGTCFWGAVTAKAIPETGTIRYIDGAVEDITAFKNLIEGLHTAVAASDELLSCPDLDSLYRRAVELARDKLNVERCALFVKIGNKWQGTFGTNLDGKTTDERLAALENSDVIQSFLIAIRKKRESSHWKEFSNWMHQEWDNKLEKHIDIGRGWLVMTAIRMPQSQHIAGIFFNDTAINGNPIDRTQQEIIAVYCCLLGSLIAAKREEQKRRMVNHKTIDNWKYWVKTAIQRECQNCPDFRGISKNVDLAIERIDYLFPDGKIP